MLAAYFLFFAKLLTFVLAILALFAGILIIAAICKKMRKGKLTVEKLNDHYLDMKDAILAATLAKSDYKKRCKDRKAKKKAQKSADTQTDVTAEKTFRKKIFVLNFKGDMRASCVESLREEITALLKIATSQDEVVLRLESAGGFMPNYGLAASQLQRIRKHRIPLTVIVDKIAASGGYMMAAVADRILAAPFAILGSVGVIAQLPNFNRVLKNHGVDFEQITAGKYKRTLTVFGKNTEKGRAKLQAELEEAHGLFQSFIKAYRPHLDVESIATGEHWYGTRALTLNMIDAIETSDDYLLTASEQADIYALAYKLQKTWRDRFKGQVCRLYENLAYKDYMC